MVDRVVVESQQHIEVWRIASTAFGNFGAVVAFQRLDRDPGAVDVLHVVDSCIAVTAAGWARTRCQGWPRTVSIVLAPTTVPWQRVGNARSVRGVFVPASTVAQVSPAFVVDSRTPSEPTTQALNGSIAHTRSRCSIVIPDCCCFQVAPPFVVCRIVPSFPTAKPLWSSAKLTPLRRAGDPEVCRSQVSPPSSVRMMAPTDSGGSGADREGGERVDDGDVDEVDGSLGGRELRGPCSAAVGGA